MDAMDNLPISHALDGLRVGDAFGFKLSTRPQNIVTRTLPDGPWFWSDDTAMASVLSAVLVSFGCVQTDELFAQFVACYLHDPRRGYGSGMKKLLGRTSPGAWRQASAALFSGQGSMGNGAAMRVPVLGAFFAEDLNQVVEQARLSAIVTHTHEEAIAGAIAVACAAAIKRRAPESTALDLINQVLAHTPESRVRVGIKASLQFGASDFDLAVQTLGNGSKITAPDTVPLCIWWSAHAPDSFEEAMWTLVGAGGDEDTNCAIVGGILGAGYVHPSPEWLGFVEDAPSLTLMSLNETMSDV